LPAEFIDWRYVIYPLILLIVMLFRPQGIMGTKELGFLKPPRNAKRKREAPADETAQADTDPDRLPDRPRSTSAASADIDRASDELSTASSEN